MPKKKRKVVRRKKPVAAKKRETKKKKPVTRPSKKKRSRALERERERRMMAEQLAIKERRRRKEVEKQINYLKKLTKKFVEVEDVEFIRRRGGIAKYPTALRHLPSAEFRLLRKKLKKAIEGRDTDDAYMDLVEMSAEYEVPVRELYTLWFSP